MERQFSLEWRDWREGIVKSLRHSVSRLFISRLAELRRGLRWLSECF